MGQKIKPNSFRLGVIRDWNAKWFPKKGDFKTFLEEDVLIREIIRKKIGLAGIDQILIERSGSDCRVYIRAAKPGLIIGRGGKGIEDLSNLIKRNITKLRKEKGITNQTFSLSLNIEEIKRNEVSAAVVAQNIAKDLEKRMPFRRVIKKYLESILQNREVKGAKIKVSGRLDGAEIARSEYLAKGNLPLQTLRVNIDYGQATAYTTYGTIGVKVWINKGEVFAEKTNSN